MAQASRAGGMSAGAFWGTFSSGSRRTFRVSVSDGSKTSSFDFETSADAERHIAWAVSRGFTAHVEVL